MARTKVHQAPTIESENEQDSTTPSRRTRRQTKSRVVPQIASDLEVDDIEEIESVQTSSPPLVAKPKAKRKSRKSNAAKASSDLTDDADPEPTHQLAKDGRRKGGNKRKFTHEYCLTCTNYGRACGGRREGDPGCLMCREPNREKGEKLRECLWAEPEKGINNYREAREALKQTQNEAKIQKARAPRRSAPLPIDLDPVEQPAYSYHTAPDPLGIVPLSRVAPSSQPSISRPLDLLPPRHSTGTIRSPSTNGYHPYVPQVSVPAPDHDRSTITVNAMLHARNRSHPASGQVHRPEVIELPQESRPYDEHSRPTSMPQPAHHFPSSGLPVTWAPLPGGVPLPDYFARFFQPENHAYVITIYPHTNILPPQAYTRPHAESYISPYDAGSSLLLSTNGRDPPRAVVSHHLPARNTGFYIPPKINEKAKKKKNSFDKSGVPCRRWSRSESKVTTLSGYEIKTKGWKAGVNGTSSENSQESEHLALNGNTVSSNAVSASPDARKSVESSELSSAIDVDESMLTATADHNGGKHDPVEVIEIPPHDGDVTESEGEESASEGDDPHKDLIVEEEEPDRLQAVFDQVYNEQVNGAKKRKISPPTKPAEKTRAVPKKAAGFTTVNGNYSSSSPNDPNLTESEGGAKTVPPHMRTSSAKAKTKSFENMIKTFQGATPKPARVNGFATVNGSSSSKRKGLTSLEHKRKVFAEMQDEDVEMEEA